MLIELIHNAALLLALGLVYEVSKLFPVTQKGGSNLINGLLIGLIGIAIMLVPVSFTAGVLFDTRSVLISVAALTFGYVPALVASLIVILFRITEGGIGMSAGIAVILGSAAIGLLFRHLLQRNPKCRWAKIYIMGLIVHVVMLGCMFIMPWETAINTAQQVVLSVLIIYPLATLLLASLLLRLRERNESLMKAAQAEEMYRSLFENNHAIMLLVNPENGRIVNANPAAAKFYGWSVAQMKKMNIAQINTLPEEKVRQSMASATNQKNSRFLFRHRKADGEVADVEVTSGPVNIDGKRMLYSIIHDVSARVRADRELHESEMRFRQLVENAPYAITILICDQFAYLNRSALKLFGAERSDELLGSYFLDYVHPDERDDVAKVMQQFLEENQPMQGIERTYLKLDSTLVEAVVTVVPFNYENQDGVIVFARDVTERKRLQRQMQEAESQVRQKQKLESLGTLAGGVAHEINNPITGIINYAQLILDVAEPASQQAEYAGEIIQESQRISVIVRNLLQFSRQEKQSHSYASVYDIVDRTISLVRTLIRKDNIDLIVELDDDLPDIKCRSQQIQQVIMNLLTNARDALNEKYPAYDQNKFIRLRGLSFEEGGRRWIRISVEDRGNGIPREYGEKIFEPFFSSKPKDLGTGLGLSISFGIIQDHHGSIRYETAEGRYTKFIIELPVDNGWQLEGSHDADKEVID